MNKYLIVAPSYPSDKENYNSAFVHSRAKEYLKRGINIEVLVISKFETSYIYEGVKVSKLPLKKAEQKLKTTKYKKILCHFGFYKQISLALNNTDAPLIIWFHGVDIISWRRRLHNFIPKRFVQFGAYIIINTFRRMYLYYVRKRYSDRITFVFVSEWLKQVAEQDIFSKNKIKNYKIIPNPIDTELFKYKEKKEEDRLKFFTIKSFDSKNYATDIIKNIILELSKKSYFNELNFTIVGKGRLWKKNTEELKQFDNVELINSFRGHEEIKKLHDQNGVMLMPSRQDTHGISTCEGMSSGLVAVSSNNSAIPEFVPKECNYLGNSIKDFVEIIDKIYREEAFYKDNSKNTSKLIYSKCSFELIIEKEIEIITN